jgi:hypothetical protein
MTVVRDRALLDTTEESEGKLDISVLKDAFVHGSRSNSSLSYLKPYSDLSLPIV